MQIRLAAFDFLAEQVQRCGDVLPARVLRDGFEFEGARVRLIFKPALLPEIPLSITTAPPDDTGPLPNIVSL